MNVNNAMFFRVHFYTQPFFMLHCYTSCRGQFSDLFFSWCNVDWFPLHVICEDIYTLTVLYIFVILDIPI